MSACFGRDNTAGRSSRREEAEPEVNVAAQPRHLGCYDAARISTASIRLCLAFLLGCASVAVATTPGELVVAGPRPSYTDKTLSAVPNAAALRVRCWSPRLDDGFVPQGIALDGDRALVVAYRSADEKNAFGPSRVFAVDPSTGAVSASFALPEEFAHPGGLARDGATLYVVNFGTLLRVDLARSLASGRAVITGRRAVAKPMGPSFVTFHEDALWFGCFVREAAAAPRLYRVPIERIFGARNLPPLDPRDATHSLPLPVLAQGVAFDGRGRLWVSASLQKEGWLYQLALDDGRVLARHAMPAGIEGLVQAGADRLWSIGECGTRRWLSSPTFFPVIFEIDLAALKPERR
ncbi:MAG: hypothetical protein HYV96_18470 [Opitutae bacterium]|nr:hypothetical protein [Opitutae bacterium]